MKLVLFDIDGTLTPARQEVRPDMLECLQKLNRQKDIDIGFVGGSDLRKQIEQLKEENFKLFKWRFSENGLLAFKDDQCIGKQSFVETLGEQHFKKFINITLHVLSETDCPVKRGTFIEYRNGMLNISPIGRACSQSERDDFFKYDMQFNVRLDMIQKIDKLWKLYLKENLLILPEICFSIGGQISVDVFPKGWDKTYCLQFVEDQYDEIYFIGDSTDKGGNDYEIYIDKRVKGYKVEKYQDTIELLTTIFSL